MVIYYDFYISTLRLLYICRPKVLKVLVNATRNPILVAEDVEKFRFISKKRNAPAVDILLKKFEAVSLILK